MRRDRYPPILIVLALLFLPMLWGCAASRLHPGAAPEGPPAYGGTERGPTRVVIVPFYTEEGGDTGDLGMQTLHYRMMMRFISDALVRHGFDVINPFAEEASGQAYNRIKEQARQDSALACLEMCKQYGADAAYMVWIHVSSEGRQEGLCKAQAHLDGLGYDSTGRDLGAGISKTFELSSQYCDDAISDVEKKIGDLIGTRLGAWQGRMRRDRVSPIHRGGQERRSS